VFHFLKALKNNLLHTEHVGLCASQTNNYLEGVSSLAYLSGFPMLSQMFVLF